ncbi:uncharacterized protein LOC129719984 [Wyeomyia smithii]|uniref:uncharacterized protein LOC129719984 n=1 Tax=Wyeomyia smithii TaxID=174621 RepID=UPI002467E7C0|nr:uncharacterized protein LOC129719984 [Wyeomyia smithii]
MHVFVDASEKAYACAVYLRTYTNDGNAQCALLAGKAKVAPVKPMSIPRLELRGCVLGTKLAKYVQDQHSVSIAKHFFWTDSTTSLSWIRADPHNYRPFVAHRIGEILDSSSVAEWRWVPSRLNPADEATKWGKGPYFSNNKPIVATTEESRTAVMLHAVTSPVIRYERFSRYERLHRAMGYVLRFLNNVRPDRPKMSGQLQQHELQAAKEAIYKQVQLEVYAEEVLKLMEIESAISDESKTIDKHSSIYQYMPVLDDREVLRQSSRARKAKDLPFDSLYPVLLPKAHPVTLLLIDYYHHIYRHANPETAVNDLISRVNVS